MELPDKPAIDEGFDVREPTADNDDDTATFELRTASNDPFVCAAPDCDHAFDGEDPPLNRVLFTEIEKHLIDWGIVGFCSVECAETFLSLDKLEIAGTEHVLQWEPTILATLQLPEDSPPATFEWGLGRSHETALKALTDGLDDYAIPDRDADPDVCFETIGN